MFKSAIASCGQVCSGVGIDPLLVSVIIANFNYADFVGTAIASALGQTYQRIEVIVVDDGSTDRSFDEISRFLPRIEFIQANHQGQIGACLEGLRRSSGEIVIFLDADDALLPDAVEILTRPFRDRTDVVKVQGYMSVVDRDGRGTGTCIPKLLPASGDYFELTLNHGLLPMPFAFTSGNAWSRGYLQQLLPLPTVGWLDNYLHDLAPLYGRIESVREIVVQYRVHGKNDSHGSRILTPAIMREYINKVNRNIDNFADFMEERGYPTNRLKWRRRKRSWRDVLIEMTVNRVSGSGRRISFIDFVGSPLGRRRESLLKDLSLCLLLAVIWSLPNRPSIALSHWVLRSISAWR
ncbi:MULTISPECIES: glycosyltransferase family 2 protein [unclassified Thiocapsa]|uniref:glycosyltransferase family 2 protein n=1 Tax=unclassified Thiocapsa TaxID=2641286 RepID=UPI0035B1DEF0